MKNLFTLLLVTLFTSGVAFSQDAFKDLKNAEKAIKKYTSDLSKTAEMDKGLQLLESAFASDEVKASAKSWITKGKILKNIANAEFKQSQINQTPVVVKSAAYDAYDAFANAMKIADRKNEQKEIQVGIKELEGHLNNFAIVAYQNKDYAEAFKNFKRSIQAYEAMKVIGDKSRLEETPELLTDQYFFTAVSAYYADNKEDAVPYLDKLYSDGTKEAFVYEALYNINAETNQEKALEFLAKGREMSPDDTGLLFAEINHYLKVGDTDKLISNLEKALEKEPENVSIYTTIGSVYDQLQQSETDPAKSAAHFDKARGYFDEVLKLEPENFDAQYSIGALYYNKAAKYVDVLNDLASDLSPAGTKKYDETKVKMDELFEKALPFFLKAEAVNANDGNTIIALKEIYARMNNLEKSNEYKAKMDALR